MDSELILLILLALSFPVLSLASFILILRQRSRLSGLEERVSSLARSHSALQQQLQAFQERHSASGPIAGATAPVTAQPSQPAQQPLPAPAAPVETAPASALAATPPDAATASPADLPAAAPAGAASSRETAPAAKTAPAARAAGSGPSGAGPSGPGRRSLEERLGARWSVWVGALALAIGGLMLVRFSIEQGYFGPQARVVFGVLLGGALAAAGEWMRRRDLAAGRVQPADGRLFATPGAPAALTAAGAACVFGAVYAAHALYGLMGPGVAFILLGVVALLAMTSAALQGPAMAALGLPAALAAPLLISSNQPRLWPLVLYVAMVTLAAHALARIRRWRWLALAAASGAWLWSLALLSAGADDPLAAPASAIIQLLLSAAVFAFLPYWRTPDQQARPDIVAVLALAAFAALGVGGLDLAHGGVGRVVIGAALVAILLGAGLSAAAVAGASVLAGAVAACALWVWPVARLATSEEQAQTLAPGGVGAAPMPENLTLYLVFAVLAAAAVSAFSLRRLLRGARLPLPAAASYAAAAVLTPPGLLAIVWMKTAHFAASIPFAIVAALLAAAGVALVSRLRQGPDAASPNQQLATGALASASVASIALGLTFALDKGMLTVAFALMAPATAWVATRMDLPALRRAVAAIGLLVLARLAANPAIAAEGATGATPIFNWLLWGYGAPALAFAGAARLLAAVRRDRITALCESLAIVFSALLVVFEIRHALNDGDPFAASSSHLEAGLIVVCGLLFAMTLSRMNLRRTDPVYRIGSLIFTLASFAVTVFGLLIGANPLNGHEEVLGGTVFNSLIPAYLAPAIIAGLLARANRAAWPRWRTLSCAALSLALAAAYVILEIRRYFQGPNLDIAHGAGNAEWLCYTAALLAIGVGLLAAGLVRRRRILRQASAIFIVAAVLKAFLSDMADLDGMWRALSFIGLGLVLIGIARAYQLLLVPPPDAGGPAGPGEKHGGPA